MRLKPTDDTNAAARQGHRPSAASGFRMSGGDDLSRARLFCHRANGAMRAIIDADRPLYDNADAPLAKGRDPEWLCGRLSVIQREAKRARARAIYRSAQDALGLIQRCNNHMPIDWKRVDGRLFVLNKLLDQYETGLSQVAPVKDDDDEAGPQDMAADFDPVRTIARDTLQTLLPHASAEEKTALQRLMDADTALDITPEEPEDSVAEQLPPPVVAAPQPRADRLEWIMPDLVQSLLGLGREYGKIFSVSHSLDEVLIEADRSDAVRARIEDTLGPLIMGSLPLQGVGRIDIGEGLDGLRLSGSGFESFDLPLPERVTAPKAAAAAPLPLTLPRPAAPPVKMITDSVEAMLREQLAALMDGSPSASSPKS